MDFDYTCHGSDSETIRLLVTGFLNDIRIIAARGDRGSADQSRSVSLQSQSWHL